MKKARLPLPLKPAALLRCVKVCKPLPTCQSSHQMKGLFDYDGWGLRRYNRSGS